MTPDWQDESLPWRERYRSFLKSPEWKAKREEVFRVKGKRCEYCGTTNPPIHLHHLDYSQWSDAEVSQLMPLCKYHHQITERYLKGVVLPVHEMERRVHEVLELNERHGGVSED